MKARSEPAPVRAPEAPEDARVERTRLRLAAAVIALASECDITEASVTRLARRAGINRSTFYDYAQTPVELLTHVLASDLDRVRQNTMQSLVDDGMLLRELTRVTLRQIVDHVLKYEAVYDSPSRTSSRYALRVVLAEHVEQSILIVFREGFVVPPIPNAEAPGLFSAFIAHGVAAAVEVWLRLPRPRSVPLLLNAVESAYPTWYAPHAKGTRLPERGLLTRKSRDQQLEDTHESSRSERDKRRL